MDTKNYSYKICFNDGTELSIERPDKVIVLNSNHEDDDTLHIVPTDNKSYKFIVKESIHSISINGSKVKYIEAIKLD